MMAERDSSSSGRTGSVVPSDKQTETNGSSKKQEESAGEVKPRFHYLKKLFMPWKWRRKKRSEKFKSISTVLERKMSTRMSKDQLMEMGLIPPSHTGPDSSILKSTENPCYDEEDFAREEEVSESHEVGEFDGSWVTEVGVIPPPAMFSPAHSSASLVSVMAVGEGLDLSDPLLSEKIGRFSPHLKDINENKEVEKAEVEAINLSLSLQAERSVSATPRLAEVVRSLMVSEQNKLVLQVTSPGVQKETSDSKEKETGSSIKRKLASPVKENSPFPARPPLKEKPANICCHTSQEEWREKRERIGRSLERRLSTRPSAEELRDRNLIPKLSREEKEDIKRRISVKLERRLSIRPTETDLKNRNILKLESSEQTKQKQEETKTILQRKLSIRPSVSRTVLSVVYSQPFYYQVAELRRRKILKFSDYLEVVECENYDRTADKPWTRLTPRDKATIRKELNE